MADFPQNFIIAGSMCGTGSLDDDHNSIFKCRLFMHQSIAASGNKDVEYTIN